MRHQRQIFFCTRAQMQQQSRVATVVQNHVAVATVAPLKNTVGVIPIVGQAFAFNRKYRRAASSNRCRSVVLGGINIA